MECWLFRLTCVTTRALHVEVVLSLEADPCLAAITGFIARRCKLTIISRVIGRTF